MKNLFQPIQILSLLLFVACNSDDNVVSTAQPQPGDALELTVSAADFVTDGDTDTRATDNGKETTFEEDDRVGVIVLGEGGSLLYNNIPYVYKSGSWTFDSNNDEGKGGCYSDSKAKIYIVYYPYHKGADGCKSESELKDKFTPQTDQSTEEAYRASDLMVWNSSSLTPLVKTLNVELKHAFASVSLAPTVGKYILEDGSPYTGNYTPNVSDISDVSLTIDNAVYVPFQATDGSLRCIVPAGITPGEIRCFYTIGGKTYGNTITLSNAVVNNRYAYKPEIKDVTYSLDNAKVGDFYCDKGYLIPGDVRDLTNNQKTACIGIVFWVGSKAFAEDPSLKNEHPGCTHGLVVALHDAGSTNINWSKYNESIQGWVNMGGYSGDVNLQEMNKMCGYSNTLALVAYNAAKGDGNGYRVLPCDAIQEYSKSKPAPTNSSGWYFPSVMELKYVCRGQEQGQGITGRNNLNSYINKVNGTQFGSDSYWSSTEDSDESNARGVTFDNGTLFYASKSSITRRVRPLLAF